MLSLMFILSACATTESSLTLEANYALAGTQVADLRITATVQSARAETTLDFMGTRSSLGATQSIYLESTLIATGYPEQALATQRQIILGNTATARPTATPLAETSDQTGIATTVPMLETFTPTVPGVTLNAPQPTATVTTIVQVTQDPNGLRFGNLVTATGAGDDGCGTGINSIFSTDVGEIYAILPVFNITANQSTFSARWSRDGQLVGPIYDFSPDFDADELCIWFFADETDFEFLPASYTVTIDVNGQPATAPAPFIIQ
ncbi:MAG: hypothetical protein Phog2KO_25510 [Phototrophicaceae bacterium]